MKTYAKITNENIKAVKAAVVKDDARNAERLTKAAERAEAQASALWTKARAIEAAADEAQAEADADITDADAQGEARRLLVKAEAARVKAFDADDKAEAARTRAEAATTYADELLNATRVIVICREATPADEAFTDALRRLRQLENGDDDAAVKACVAENEARTFRAALAEARGVADDEARVIGDDGLAVYAAIADRLGVLADDKAAQAAERRRLHAEKAADADELKKARQAVKKARKERDEAAKAAPRLAFVWGAPINAKRPRAALVCAHELTADALRRLGLLGVTASQRAYIIPTYTDDGEALTNAARAVAAGKAKAMIQRQGTPTQWAIYHAACAGRFDDGHLADIVSVAALALLEAKADDDAAGRAGLGLVAEWTAKAYAAIDKYLASLRAIRADAHADAVPFDEIENYLAAPTDDEQTFSAIRRRIIAQAVPRLMDALTDAQKRTTRALYASYGDEAVAARRLGVSRQAIHKTRRAVETLFAAALRTVAPDSIEDGLARTICEYDAAADAAQACAALAEAKRRKGRRAQAVAELNAAAVAFLESLPQAQADACRLISQGASVRDAAAALHKSHVAVIKARKLAEAKARNILRGLGVAVADDAALADILALF